MHVYVFSICLPEEELQTGTPWMAALLNAKLGFVPRAGMKRQRSKFPLLGAVSHPMLKTWHVPSSMRAFGLVKYNGPKTQEITQRCTQSAPCPVAGQRVAMKYLLQFHSRTSQLPSVM